MSVHFLLIFIITMESKFSWARMLLMKLATKISNLLIKVLIKILRGSKTPELNKCVLVNSNRLWEVDLEDIDVSFSEVDNDTKTLTNTTHHSASIPIYSLDKYGEITKEGTTWVEL